MLGLISEDVLAERRCQFVCFGCFLFIPTMNCHETTVKPHIGDYPKLTESLRKYIG